MIGTILSNRYKIISELGSGGMAWVYLAEDLVEDQRVAVKVLYPQHSQDLNFLQRFMQEAKLAMGLSQHAPSSHVVRVLDYGSDRDIHYLVMEYVQGQDLSRILTERGPLPWREALEIARQVAMALDDAHRYEIVHRDIKPGNIMVLADGSVRVLDFGIARARTSPSLTMSGFVGSPHYAAPEQAMGEPVDTRADLYSLGIVLYRMLSGDLPFQGKTPWAIVNQHIAAPPPPLHVICPDLSQPIIDLVEKAMAKRPDDRFQTPDDMVLAIEALLADLDLPAELAAVQPDVETVPLEELYERALQAMEAEAWHEAVDLFSRILRADPDYRDAKEQVTEAGQQIRLATLYRAAKRALQLGQWDEALAQVDRIARVAPDYRDIDELRAKAESQQKLEGDSLSPVSDYPTQIETEDMEPAVAGASVLAASSAQAEGTTPAEDKEEIGAPSPVSEGTGRRRGLLWAVVLAAFAGLLVTGLYLSGIFQSSPVAVSTTTSTPTETAMLTPTQTTLPTPLPSATTTEPPPTQAPTSTNTAVPAAQGTTATLTPTLTPTPTLTTTPSPAPTRRAALTGQIAFPRFNQTLGVYDVFVCQVDGSNCRRVAADSSQPDFLPDGDQLVVHSWDVDDRGFILQTLSGQRIWKITDDIEVARPSVDFEGKLYAYHSRQEADREPRLYRTYDAETRPIRREGNPILGQSPSWLPDGRILYSGCWQTMCGIIAMRNDGSNPRQIVAGSTETNPEASPDGRRITFMSQRDGNWEIYVVNIDGSNLRRLTTNSANDGLPTWSPDGRYIAFVSNRENGWAMWVMRSDGSQKRELFKIGPIDGRVRAVAPHESRGWVEERISWAPLP
jgi:tRNA A-37 threonylcarbamoyl transferase component Bud32